jgi:HPt (histidine-containing phosphotransfer) domain-containing protein
MVTRDAERMPPPAPPPGESPAAPAEPVFDLEDTLARFMDDRELLCMAMSACLAQAPGTLGKLQAALESGDAEAAGAAAHALKGSTATVGAAHVAQIAREMENGLAAGETAPAQALMPALQKAFRRFARAATVELELSSAPAT